MLSFYPTCVVFAVCSHCSVLKPRSSINLTVLTWFEIWNWGKRDAKGQITHFGRNKKKVFGWLFPSCSGLIILEWQRQVSARGMKQQNNFLKISQDIISLQSLMLKDIFSVISFGHCWCVFIFSFYYFILDIKSIQGSILISNYVHVCIHSQVFVHKCRCMRRPEGGIRSLQGLVTACKSAA